VLDVENEQVKGARIGLANGRELEVYEIDMKVLYYRQRNERDNGQ
jgi:nitrogen fixation protein